MTIEEKTVSIDVSTISTELIQTRVDTLGAKIDEMRAERRYFQGVLHDRRVAAHKERLTNEVQSQIEAVSGVAPGALFDLTAGAATGS